MIILPYSHEEEISRNGYFYVTTSEDATKERITVQWTQKGALKTATFAPKECGFYTFGGWFVDFPNMVTIMSRNPIVAVVFREIDNEEATK